MTKRIRLKSNLPSPNFNFMLTLITESEISYVLPPLGFFHMLCLWFLLKMCYVAGHTVACQLSAVMKMSLWAIDTSYEEITVLIHNCSSDMKQYITTSTTKKTSETQYTPCSFFCVQLFKMRQVCMHRKAPEGVSLGLNRALYV